MQLKVIITGGHSTGLGLSDLIREKHPNWQIYYFGRKYSFENNKVYSFDYKVVSRQKGIKFIALRPGRWPRTLNGAAFLGLLRIPLGLIQSFYWLSKIRPAIIFAFGGYVSVPVVFSGWLLKIPIVSHEQTQVVGLATRLNSRFSRKVAVAFPQLVSRFPSGKAVYTGLPLRKSLNNKDEPGKLETVKELMAKEKKLLIYVTTGKAGSLALNKVITEILSKISEKYLILHQTGEMSYPSLQILAKKNKYYFPYSFLSGQEQAWALNNAELVISRAGANITFELLKLKRPGLLVPLPNSDQDEQKKNARWFVSLGGGGMINQSNLSARSLIKKINQILTNKNKYARALKKVKIKNGAQDLLLLGEKYIL
ncbi:MAG: glycosyltransferase [Candidatus Shapirobacteria bacterium]